MEAIVLPLFGALGSRMKVVCGIEEEGCIFNYRSWVGMPETDQ